LKRGDHETKTQKGFTKKNPQKLKMIEKLGFFSPLKQYDFFNTRNKNPKKNPQKVKRGDHETKTQKGFTKKNPQKLKMIEKLGFFCQHTVCKVKAVFRSPLNHSTFSFTV